MPPSDAPVVFPDHQLRCLLREPPGGPSPKAFGPGVARRVRRFHRRLPGYTPTPLVPLKRLARTWGLRDILVKDEAKRFGLKAFKVLGGSYAVARLICAKLGRDIETITYPELTGDEVRRRIGCITLATATGAMERRA